MRLETTEAEAKYIDDAISWMSKYMLRLNLEPLTRPIAYDVERRQADTKKVDIVIAGAMDMLRKTVKQDFFEKAYDKVSDFVDNTADPNMIYVWARMTSTFTSIISVTKRYRGEPRKPPTDENAARDILKERGLWKR